MDVTAYERIMKAIMLGQADRVPILPMARMFCIRYAGLNVSETFQNPDKYVNAHLKMTRDFSFDAVYDLYSGAPLFNEFLGAKLTFGDAGPPTAAPVFESIEDFKKAERVDLSKIKRMEDVHWMVKKLKEEVAGTYPVIAFAHYPFRSAALLRGVQNFFMDLVMNPSFVRDLLDFCLDMCKSYAEIVIDAGADIIFTSQSVSNRDCISRQHYEQFVTGHESFLNSFIKSKNKKILHHTCGDWSDRFDLAVAEGPDVLYVSSVADLAELKAKYGNKICIMGNLHCVDILQRGTPDQVEKECYECIKKAGAGGGFILSGDCDLAFNTPTENVRAMQKAGTTFGVYPLKLQ